MIEKARISPSILNLSKLTISQVHLLIPEVTSVIDKERR